MLKDTLGLKGITANNVTVTAALNKDGFAFIPGTQNVTVYKALSTDTGLSALTLEGCSFTPVFATNTLSYEAAEKNM